MLLREAKEILEENGFIIEGWKDDRAEWEKVRKKKYNGEYYRKWNDNGKTQKINVKDSSLEPDGVEWYPRW